MKLRCPVCHSSNSLEAYAADDAGRELLKLLAGSGPLFRPLVAYLGCFRPAARDLAHDRAPRLAREVLELPADPRALAAALAETVEAMRAKREAGDVRPLKNHNYLKRVLENTTLPQPLPSREGGFSPSPLAGEGRGEGVSAAVPRGKRRQAVELLGEWGSSSRLRQAVAVGLTALVAIGRPGTPAADMICVNADLWLHLLSKHGLVECDEDVDRVFRAFSSLVQQPMKDYPEPAAIVPHLPQPPAPGPHHRAGAERRGAGRRGGSGAAAAGEVCREGG